MTNRLRTEIEQEEEADIPVAKKSTEIPDNFWMKFFTKEFITTDDATRALPFVLFIAFLGMIYIGNRHLAEKSIRDIDKLSKQVKEIGWEYKVSKAELAFKSTLSEVAKRADTLGVKESLEPAQKIVVQEVAQ